MGIVRGADHTFDQERSEAFAGRMNVIVNDAALAVMVSVGHRVGLFDAMAGLPWATVREIADAAGLQERYVREWLGAMVTGRVVDYDRDRDSYALPAEHAAKLTRTAGSENWAAQAQYIPALAQAEDAVVGCFREGGGIPYSAYPGFQRVMSDDTGTLHEETLVADILPLVPGLPERLQAGIQVADVGCGHGRATNVIGRAFPRSSVVGYDLSEEGLAMARVQARDLGLTNVRFELQDLASGIPGRFDLITTFDTIHDLAQPERALMNIAAGLRAGGVFLMGDYTGPNHVDENLDHSMGPMMYMASCMHCVPVSLGLGGPGLGCMWAESTARRLLAAAGFANVALRKLEGDTIYGYFLCTKD